MKRKLLQYAIAASMILVSSYAAKAQKFGDNLGNHTATKNLEMKEFQILNTSGVAIGSATLANESVALQIDGADKSILISRTDDLAKIVNPLNGMMVYLDNGTDSRFYLRQNGAWSTFATALKKATSLGAPDDFGYTITFDATSQETILSLSPATATQPGIVTIDAQEFGGDKTFIGNVVVGTATTPTTTTLNGTLTATGATTLNSTLSTAGTTTLNGTYDATTPVAGGVIINSISDAANSNSVDERPLVIDAVTGVVKRSVQAVNALDKKTFPIASATAFEADGNSGVEVVITIDPVADQFLIKQDDGIVVNFAAADYAALKGLTILSSVATADNQVTVYLADMRNPADTTLFPTGYVAPNLTGKNLVITKYNKN